MRLIRIHSAENVIVLIVLNDAKCLKQIPRRQTKGIFQYCSGVQPEQFCFGRARSPHSIYQLHPSPRIVMRSREMLYSMLLILASTFTISSSDSPRIKDAVTGQPPAPGLVKSTVR